VLAQQQLEQKRQKREIIRQKILFIGRMNRMLKTLRTNQEEILQIKQMTPDGKLPLFTLIGGSQEIHKQVEKFFQTRISDQKNEGFPLNSRRVSQKTKQLLEKQAQD